MTLVKIEFYNVSKTYLWSRECHNCDLELWDIILAIKYEFDIEWCNLESDFDIIVT